MPGSFLEEIGAVKTPRREAESILLAKAALRGEPATSVDRDRILKLAKHNKVLLRASQVFEFSEETVNKARKEVNEVFQLYDLMSKTLDSQGVGFVVIKSFDSLPDMGHDLDFLVSSPQEFRRATSLLLREFRVRPQSLTHCDKLLGKFSCFLPGFVHDFELYPTISQLGERHLDPVRVLEARTKVVIEGREIWLTSDIDRVLIRVVHAMYRHNFLKLSDVLDFLSLIGKCSQRELLERVDESGLGDSLTFFLATIERFLKACDYESPELSQLIRHARERLGKDRLGFLRRDRLVLPYRIPSAAIMLLFLLKAGRDASRGRWKSAGLCLTTPVLIVLDFVNAIFNHRLFRRRIW